MFLLDARRFAFFLLPFSFFLSDPLRGPTCFVAAAFSIISSSILPVAPPLAGRFDVQIAGVSAARMSSKSPPLLTLSGANSAMSTGPAQSSRCLISSQLRPRRTRSFRPTSTHEPFSFTPSSVNFRSPFFSAPSTSSTSGVQVPGPTASRCRRRILPGSRLRSRRIDRVIFDVHREPFVTGSARVLWGRPRTAARRYVRAGSRSADGWRGVLHAEKTVPFLRGRFSGGSRRAGGFGSFLGVTLLFVFF